MVEVIAISNRCELDSLENLFSRESLKLGRIETKGSIRYSYYLYHEDIPMLQHLTYGQFLLFMHKHCIAKTKEAVTFFDGVLIRF